MAEMLQRLAFSLLLIVSCSATIEFVDYGVVSGDVQLTNISAQLHLTRPIIFHGKSYTSAFVSFFLKND